MTGRKLDFISIVVLLISAIWIGISIDTTDRSSLNQIRVPQRGFTAPDFSLSTLSGETIKLSDLNGTPVIVNYWASWCLPCRSEMPAIQSAYEKNHDQGLLILAVNATNQDSIDQVQKFTKELDLTFPILLDTDGAVGNLYQVSALPTTFFINSSGIIEEIVVGGPMAEALLLTRIDRLLESR